MSLVEPNAQVRIRHDVLEELAWDPHVDDTEVGIEVDDGVVTLTGTVTSWAKRAAPAGARVGRLRRT